MMNRIQTIAGWLAMAAALTMGMTACTQDDNIIEEAQPTPEATRTYTMTVEATMGGDDATTRALAIDDVTGALNATWTAGDVVSVYKQISEYESQNIGTLTATNISADGRSCTLTGDLVVESSIVINENDELTLQFNNGGYASQNGTLDYIATNCDIAKATVKVASVTIKYNKYGFEQAFEITTTGHADFVNQQAIVKFTLKDSNGSALSVKQLRVKYGTTTIKVTPDAAASVLYVAIPGGSATVTMTATMDDTSIRYYKKTGVAFANGQYYTVGVKMTMGNVNLATLTEDYEAKDGDILYGTLPPDLRLSIRSGAEVTLNGVTTQKCLDILAHDYPGIECLGNATINLCGLSTVIASGEFGPGIYVPKSKTLTIQGNGTLNASGLPYNAGIGGGDSRTAYKDCGNITITGGNITATGGTGAAGIGSVDEGTCGDIKISGGTVTATGGTYAAGIGSGYKGTCGTITITGGSGTATKGDNATCSIGKGKNGSSGKVKVFDADYGTSGISDSPFEWSITP